MSKCFYVYFEDPCCPDCGAAERHILKFYQGVPDREKMKKVAREILKNIPEEEFSEETETVTVYGHSPRTVSVDDNKIVCEYYGEKEVYETEVVDVEEI